MTDAQSFTAANRAYFDKLASTYDSKAWQAKMSAQISAFLQQNVGMLVVNGNVKNEEMGKEETRLLDYACGTGLITKALQPQLTYAIGVDISRSMVQRYNDIFSSSTSPPFVARAIEADLLSSDSSSTSTTETGTEIVAIANNDFDLAVVGLGFHHFHDPAHALQVLAQKVRVGGVVGIVDFLPFPAAGAHGHGHNDHGGHQHGHAHSGGDDAKAAEQQQGAFPEEARPTIKTHGFSEEDMARLFKKAGLGDVGFAVMEGEIEMYIGKEERRVVRRVFLGRGVRVE